MPAAIIKKRARFFVAVEGESEQSFVKWLQSLSEEKNLHIELNGDILLISSEEVEPRYRKELLLPGSFTGSQMTFHCRNGVLEIQLLKDGELPS